MVAHSSPPPGGFEDVGSTGAEGAEKEDRRSSIGGGGGNPGGVRRLVSSIARLTDIQLQIWLTRAKMAAWSIALYVALFGAAAVVAMLGIIFLFIGIFHVLTDVLMLPPVWAYLIFGGVQLLLAGTLVAVAKSILTKRALPKHSGGGK
jgi:hypothetical protein